MQEKEAGRDTEASRGLQFSSCRDERDETAVSPLK